MKIRQGFVSNSSSSSFTCSVCHETESGMDASLSDFSMVECIHGHIFHESCHKTKKASLTDRAQSIRYSIQHNRWTKAPEKKVALEELDTAISEKDEYALDEMIEEWCEGNVSEVECPICIFSKLDYTDALKYMYKKYGVTAKSIAEELRGTFTSYAEFMEHIK